MGVVLLVSHGQGSSNPDEVDGLSPLGWEQARRLAASMLDRGVTPSLVVHGDQHRQRDCTQALVDAAGWSVVPEADAGWDEMDLVGMLRPVPMPAGQESASRSDFASWLTASADRWTSGQHDAEYAETFDALARRAREALSRVLRRLDARDVAVVVTAPGPIAWLATALIHGGPHIEARPDLGRPWHALNSVVVNTSVTKVVVGGRGATLVDFNDHAHLEAAGLSYR